MANTIDQTVMYPWADATHDTSLTATGTQSITISNNLSIVSGAEASGNRTLNMTAGTGIRIGALVIIEHFSAGTQTLASGTGCQFATITGVAGKTITKTLVYDGSNFIGINEQIN